MTTFLIIGAVGLVAAVIGLFLGDIDLDLGPDFLSLPVIAAVVGAIGFVGAAVVGAGGSTPLALAVGAGAGLVLGLGTYRLARGLMHMPTDPTTRSEDLLGRPGRVVTPVAPDRYGEVLVDIAGQRVKLGARSMAEAPAGTDVVVIEVLSPTSVLVEPADTFWLQRGQDTDPASGGP